MPSVVRTSSYGSVRIFWLDSDEALRRLRDGARRLIDERPEVRGAHLFGSLAEGRATPGSDADVLLVLEATTRRWIDRPLDYGAFFDGVGVPVELFCYTVAELDRTPFARRVRDRAVTLAEREAP